MKIIKILLFVLVLANQNFALSLKDIDKIDKLDREDYIKEAKQKADNENFSKAYNLLKKAKSIGINQTDYQSTKSYIQKKETDYKARVKREKQKKERQARLKRERQERQASSSKSNLDSKCAFLSGNFGAWSACMKKADNVYGMGKRGLNAYYAINRQCDNLAGNDTTGLAYLCRNENRDGCTGLKASQNTINACYQCNGSNLWLRVYAMGVVLQCN